MKMMSAMLIIKPEAKKIGLTASFVPISGIIEFYDDTNARVGVSYNGHTIKVKDKRYPIDKYFSSLQKADKILKNFKPFTNFKTQ